jgi:hypothetical protein
MQFTKKKREIHEIQQRKREIHEIHEQEAWNSCNSEDNETWSVKCTKKKREIHEIAHYSWVQKIRGEKRKKQRNTRNVKFREKDAINHLCKLLNVNFREIHVSRSQRCFAKYLDSFSAGNLRLGGRHAEGMHKQRLLFIPNAAKTCAFFMPATYETESLGDMTPLYSTSASWTALRQRSCHRNLIREEF